MTGSQLVDAYTLFSDSDYTQLHQAIEETILAVVGDLRLQDCSELLGYLGRVRLGSNQLISSLLKNIDARKKQISQLSPTEQFELTIALSLSGES